MIITVDPCAGHSVLQMINNKLHKLEDALWIKCYRKLLISCMNWVNWVDWINLTNWVNWMNWCWLNRLARRLLLPRVCFGSEKNIVFCFGSPKYFLMFWPLKNIFLFFGSQKKFLCFGSQVLFPMPCLLKHIFLCNGSEKYLATPQKFPHVWLSQKCHRWQEMVANIVSQSKQQRGCGLGGAAATSKLSF